MNRSEMMTDRERDTRPLEILFPASGNRKDTMSDSHEIMCILRDLPADQLYSRTDLGLDTLEAKTDAGLYEPDVVVEFVHREARRDYRQDPAKMRDMTVRILEAALQEGCESKPITQPDSDPMTSLTALAACRTIDDPAWTRFEATGWSPTPWCEAGATVLGPQLGETRNVVPDSMRRIWSDLLIPTLRISDRTASEARLAIRMHPHQVTTTFSLDPMERMRLEIAMAPILAGLDDGSAW